MKFEVLKRSHLKRNIIIGVVCIAIISAVVLNFTRAKYQIAQSIPLVNGTINYSLADLNIVAITIDGSEVDQIPDGNYELTGESYCTVNGKTDNSVKLSYDSSTKGLSVIPMTTKGTKCYLDFKTATTKKVDTILGQIEVNLDTPDFSKTATTDEGIYETEDDWGDSYYFRGAVTNNYVKFAEYYWRIVRINGDGSIRIIYDGTSPHANGESSIDRQIGTSAYNSSHNDNAYVGYMYGSIGASSYAETHANTNPSIIKDVLDSWYEINIADKGYGTKVSTEAGFCNDRKVYTGPSWNGHGELGYGTNLTTYDVTSRFMQWDNGNNLWKNTQNPTLKCSQLSNDMFTPIKSSKGNKKLSSPIGLITADETAFGGGKGGRDNKNYYLYTGQEYWTMSPSYLGYSAFMFLVTSGGQINNNHANVGVTYGVRPVINLANDIIIKSGNGTISSPYEI